MCLLTTSKLLLLCISSISNALATTGSAIGDKEFEQTTQNPERTKENSYRFAVETDKDVISPQRDVFNCSEYKISVYRNDSRTMGQILFNFTFWITNWDVIEVGIFQVSQVSSGHWHFETYYKNTTHHTFPQIAPLHDFVIESIDINRRSNFTVTLAVDNSPNTTEHKFQIKECFKDIFCECGLGPSIKSYSLERVEGNWFKIIWLYEQNGVNDVYYVEGHEYKYSFQEHNTFALVKLDKEHYEDKIFLKNRRNCSTTIYVNETVNLIYPTTETTHGFSWYLAVFVIILLAFLILTITIKSIPLAKQLCVLFRRQNFNIDGPETIDRWENVLIYTKCDQVTRENFVNQFDRSKLRLLTELGKGQFGVVMKGKLEIKPNEEIFVAVKLMKAERVDNTKEDFAREIALFNFIGEHENIVRMLGYCVDTMPYMIVMEYIHGNNLQIYLQNIRKEWESQKRGEVISRSEVGSYICPDTPGSNSTDSFPFRRFESNSDSYTTEVTNLSPALADDDVFVFENKPISNELLLDFALQIAKGMKYLESIGVLHRDLAARNILIDDKKNKLKISDFGMSRSGVENTQPYIMQSVNTLLPIRWMAWESIFDRVFNSKSDVWSYGIVLWEIGSLGSMPYANLERDIDFVRALTLFLSSGRRLPKPDLCNSQIYEMMLETWRMSPDERPSFAEIVERLEGPLKNIAYTALGSIHRYFPHVA